MKRKAYIARYPLNPSGNDLNEVIIERDGYWSEALRNEFDRLVSDRKPSDPMIQGWYCDSKMSELMATTNQPFQFR